MKQREEIPGRYITINAIKSCMDIPDCMAAEDIRIATLDDDHIGMLLEHILYSWSLTKLRYR